MEVKMRSDVTDCSRSECENNSECIYSDEGLSTVENNQSVYNLYFYHGIKLYQIISIETPTQRTIYNF